MYGVLRGLGEERVSNCSGLKGSPAGPAALVFIANPSTDDTRLWVLFLYSYFNQILQIYRQSSQCLALPRALEKQNSTYGGSFCH